MLLLDTCTLLWLADDKSSLSSVGARQIINNRGYLYVSAISAFEISLKVRKGKLALPQKPDKWFHTAIQSQGLIEIPLTAEIFLHSVDLPLHHRDPADRMLIATAQLKKLSIVSPDSHMKAYDHVTVIW